MLEIVKDLWDWFLPAFAIIGIISVLSLIVFSIPIAINLIRDKIYFYREEKFIKKDELKQSDVVEFEGMALSDISLRAEYDLDYLRQAMPGDYIVTESNGIFMVMARSSDDYMTLKYFPDHNLSSERITFCLQEDILDLMLMAFVTDIWGIFNKDKCESWYEYMSELFDRSKTEDVRDSIQGFRSSYVGSTIANEITELQMLDRSRNTQTFGDKSDPSTQA